MVFPLLANGRGKGDEHPTNATAGVSAFLWLWLGTKFVQTKGHIGSTFSKIFFGSCLQEEL